MMTDLPLPDPRSALETVIAVSLLIGLVLFARKPVARQFGAGIAYALWLLPVARLVLPPLPTPMSWVSLLGLAPATVLPPAASGPATPLPPPHPLTSASPETLFPPPFSGLPAEVTPVLPDAGMSGLADLFLPVLFGLWLAGTACTLLRSLLSQHSFLSVVAREKAPASAPLQALAEDVARQIGLKGKLRIATSFISAGPLVTGLFRPIVLLPAWFEQDYDEVQQRAALAHELMHIKRGDLLALQVAELFVACLWFNPLAYFARRAFRTDQEAACDSDVLRAGAASPHAYGATLLKAVRQSFPERLPLAASLPLTHSLKERLRLMAYPTPSKRRRIAGLGLTVFLGSAALIATASVTATAEEPADDSPHVLLGGAFSPPEAAEDDEIRQLRARIDAEVRKISVPPAMPPLPPMPAMPPMPDAPPVPPVNMDDAHYDDALGASEAEWDAWETEFETRTDEWQQRVDTLVQAWEDSYDAETEMANRETEARIDALTHELETRIEGIYGAEFEARFNKISLLPEADASGCTHTDTAEAEAATTTTRTFSARRAAAAVSMAADPA